MNYFICPSILSADFARLGAEVQQVLDGGADMIHFDVMDNHFVPNLTFGPAVCRSLRKAGITAPIDVHLMVQPVDRLIKDFAEAGASYISFHPEASSDVQASLNLIHELGCKSGLVFSPEVALDGLHDTLERLDMVLIMSVHPGFGGQAFIPASLEKVRQARTMIDGSNRDDIRLEVDGGINLDNLAWVCAAGADTFVMGSAIFNAPDYAERIGQLRKQLNTSRQPKLG